MECGDVREMADAFLAQERLTETNHEILQHLDTCRSCRADLVARRVLRESVRRAFQNARDLDPTRGFTMRLQRRFTRPPGPVLAAVTLALALPSHQDER